jgi:hypothetical protein
MTCYIFHSLPLISRGLLDSIKSLDEFFAPSKCVNDRTFGSVIRKIQKLENKLKTPGLAPWRVDGPEMKWVEKNLCELFEREEIMARQRSRVDWLHEGDQIRTFSMLVYLLGAVRTESRQLLKLMGFGVLSLPISKKK